MDVIVTIKNKRTGEVINELSGTTAILSVKTKSGEPLTFVNGFKEQVAELLGLLVHQLMLTAIHTDINPPVNDNNNDLKDTINNKKDTKAN